MNHSSRDLCSNSMQINASLWLDFNFTSQSKSEKQSFSLLSTNFTFEIFNVLKSSLFRIFSGRYSFQRLAAVSFSLKTYSNVLAWGCGSVFSFFFLGILIIKPPLQYYNRLIQTCQQQINKSAFSQLPSSLHPLQVGNKQLMNKVNIFTLMSRNPLQVGHQRIGLFII